MSIQGTAESYIELRGELKIPEAIQGKSAYEIAVAHGFEGTEEEWLASFTEEATKEADRAKAEADRAKAEADGAKAVVDESIANALEPYASIYKGEVEDEEEVTYNGESEDIGSGTGLPDVTEADNGKILQVVDGMWTATELPVYNGEVI